jgi:hypothetical protein
MVSKQVQAKWEKFLFNPTILDFITATALTRIPFSKSLSAKPFVKPTIAALVVA